MLKTAIILPAFNEGTTIAGCIESFHRESPEADIYVINNDSSDDTERIARETLKETGCKGDVITERRHGKAFAVRKAFHRIDADIYVLVDADQTYSASDLPNLIRPIIEDEADMVVGDRHLAGGYKRENKRTFHVLGNHFTKLLINLLFGSHLNDILSGYRVFSRNFVALYPVLSRGFELETEMTLHALDKRYRIMEIPIQYQDRPQGSYSKLNTFVDGLNILQTIVWIFKDYKPHSFFGIVSIILLALGLAMGSPVIIEYYHTSIVTRIPLAILSVGLVILSTMSFSIGIILHSIAKHQKYNYELMLNAVESRSTSKSTNTGDSHD